MTKKFAKRFLTRNAHKLAYYKLFGIKNSKTRTAYLAQITLLDHPTPWLFKQFNL
jgi:hypothetical protein